jgi:hypothetical protein
LNPWRPRPARPRTGSRAAASEGAPNQHGRGPVGHLIQQAIHFALFPAAVGIFAGLATFAISLLIIRVLALLIGGGRSLCCSSSSTRNVELPATEDEKDALMENGETSYPPHYEDVDDMQKN